MSFLYDEQVQPKAVLSRARYLDVLGICGAFGVIAAVVFGTLLNHGF